MKILSISATHDASIAIFENNKLILNLELERYKRVKGAGGYSEEFLKFCLRKANIKSINEIDELILNRKFYKSIGADLLVTEQTKTKVYQRAKATVLGKTFDAHFVHHHVAHLAGAYFLSPYSEAAVLSIDAGGEGANHGIAIGVENKIKVVELNWSTCLGYWWAKLPKLVNDLSDGPGKWMALAAYGNPNEEIINSLRYSIMHRTQSWDRVNIPKFAKLFPMDTKQSVAQDISFSLQKITEELLHGAFSNAMEIAKSKNICFSGGVALNCIGNTKAAIAADAHSLFIPPNPSDTGLAMGQALYYLHNILNYPKNSGKPFSPFTGPNYSEQEIEESVNKYSDCIKVYKPNNINEDIAQRLCDGMIGARFYGKSEAGPRALGHRSFIGLGNIKNLRSKMNSIKKREWFRPLAGIFLEEDKNKYLENQVDHSWYMNTSCKIRDEFASSLEGISHIDHTTRPQILNEKICPDTYNLLSLVSKNTGISAFLNTSYNVQEPLAETPEDAILTMLKCSRELGFMQLGHLLITKK